MSRREFTAENEHACSDRELVRRIARRFRSEWRRLSLVAAGTLLDAFRAVVGHDMSFFDENASAGIVSRITGDTNDMAQVVSLTTNLASQVLLVIPLLAILFWVHWRLALLVLVVAPAVMWASVALRRLSRPVAVRERRIRATINANVSESIGGIAVAKAFRQERTLYDAFQQLNRQA